MDAFEVLVDKLDKEVDEKRKWLASGQSKDYAEYRMICGEIRGLLFACQEILDLKHRMETQDDE